MKSVTIKVPEVLYENYKKSCYYTGTKLSHYITVAMENVVNGYSKMDWRRRKVSSDKISKRRGKRK